MELSDVALGTLMASGLEIRGFVEAWLAFLAISTIFLCAIHSLRK